MAKYTRTISAQSSEVSFNLYARRDADIGKFTFFVYGTFGGGTVTAFLSSDSGTTDIALNDSAGLAISETSDAAHNFEVCTDASDPVQLIIKIGSATTPSITVDLYDNK